jgi:hypothetical protein
VDEKIAGAVGECKFTLEDFERHISELQENKVNTPKIATGQRAHVPEALLTGSIASSVFNQGRTALLWTTA